MFSEASRRAVKKEPGRIFRKGVFQFIRWFEMYLVQGGSTWFGMVAALFFGTLFMRYIGKGWRGECYTAGPFHLKNSNTQ